MSYNKNVYIVAVVEENFKAKNFLILSFHFNNRCENGGPRSWNDLLHDTHMMTKLTPSLVPFQYKTDYIPKGDQMVGIGHSFKFRVSMILTLLCTNAAWFLGQWIW